MSDFLLFSISLAVTVLGLMGSWAAVRKRGLASGMRGAAWSLLPLGAYLTGVTKFLSDLALKPGHWAGVIILGLGAVLYMTSGVLLRRGGGDAPEVEPGPRKGDRAAAAGGGGAAPRRAVEKRSPAADSDLAEIEQILKNRGIN